LNETKKNKYEKTAYLGIGSNIDPKLNIVKLLKELRNSFDVLKVSNIWESAPVGRPGPIFLNVVVAIKTTNSFMDLKYKLRRIEADMGRVRSQDKNAPRQIDIDILILGDEIFDPDIWTQAYIAIPLAEVYPALFDKATGLSIEDISDRLQKLIDIFPREDITNS
jgi:2-amino-4-hydroxy-6-hydroxymethyldihydropteridine diphosphokinase